MLKQTLLITMAAVTFSAFAADAPKQASPPRAEQTQPDQISLQLLNAAKLAQKKLQTNRDNGADLKTIVDAKKQIERMQLKAATEFANQQAAFENRKADKTAYAAFEKQRNAVNARFNELFRLVDQIDGNKKTALLSEKLNDLIVFLEPASSAKVASKASKQKSSNFSRGAVPATQNIKK